MNILLINHYAGAPSMGMEFRPYYLAKKWVEFGHSVTIIAADVSHLRNQNPKVVNDFQEEFIDGIRYVWITTPNYNGNGVARVKNIFTFVMKLFKNTKKIITLYDPNVVIASSTYPSDNYVAHKIAKLAKAKYIYEVHDLWPLSPMEVGGMSKYHPFIMLMQHGENYAYKYADEVVSMLPNTKEHMKSHGLNLDKWHYIPNGMNLEDFNQITPLNSELKTKLQEFKNQGKISIGYAGGHALSNSLDTIIDAAILLKDNPKYIFVFVGGGNEKQNLINKAKGLSNVAFFDRIPKQEIPDLLDQMDYLILVWKKEKLYKYGISPNKIFDYLMAKKPIIHAVDAPNPFVDKADCGEHIEPQNPQAIVNAIERLSKKTDHELKQMGERGRDFAIKNHDYKVLAHQMIEIFKK